MSDAIADALPLAGRLRRLIATVLDAIFVPTLTIVLLMIAGVLEDAEDYRDNGWMVWVLLLAIASYLILNGYGLWRRGQTLGKMLLGIAIVAVAPVDEGSNASRPAPLWKLVCVRALFFPLLFFSLLFVVMPALAVLPVLDQLPIFGRQRRCLHDLLCATTVVRRPRR